MVDIVTHGGIGVVLAGPFLASAPECAAAIAFGSVLPDLDALSRLFGKRAFLACHQTWSHALPVIAVLGVAAGGLAGSVAVGAGLAAGMLLHSALDLTNTYGIALLLPLQRRRLCLEWLFFIDAGTMAITATAIAWIAASIAGGGVPGWAPTLAWLAAMLAWLGYRRHLRQLASRIAPAGMVSLIPSAWNPWRFYGTGPAGPAMRTCTVDAWNRRVADERLVAVHDAELPQGILDLPEVAAMRRLSPAYRAIALERTPERIRIAFRDLRTRNFATTFGACDIDIPAGGPPRIAFHV